jgi:hypothetical protein
MMRRKGAAGLVAAGMLLLGAAPGQAQVLPSARYLGNYEGGTVDFKVSPDGTRVTEFQVINRRYGRICAAGPSVPFGAPPSPGLPIENHAFAGALYPYAPTGFTVSVTGSFTASGMASGSFDLGPPGRFSPRPCPYGRRVSWSAVGDAAPPSVVMNTRETQSRGQKSVKVRLSCTDEVCNVVARGVVSLTAPGVARRFRLRSAGANDLSGETTLRLAIPRRAYRAIRALGSDGTVTVEVRVRARDRFDHVASARQSIRLKR